MVFSIALLNRNDCCGCNKTFKKIQLPIVLLIAFAAFAAFTYARFYGQALPWGIDAAPVASLFVYLGYIMKKFMVGAHQLDKSENNGYKDCGCGNRIFELILIPVSLILNIVFSMLNMNLLSECVDMYLLAGTPYTFIIKKMMAELGLRN